MSRLEGRIIAFSLCVAAVLFLFPGRFASGAVHSSTPGKSDGAQSEDPRKRWESLPAERKKSLLKSYNRFKALPDAEKKRLKERHKKLEMMRRGLELSGGDEEAVDRSKTKAEMNRRIQQHINRRVEDLNRRLQALPPDAVQKNRREGIRRLRQTLEKINSERLHPFLDGLVKQDLIKESEARRILSLPPSERKRRIFEVAKRRMVSQMEGLVPPDDLNRLQSLEPWAFHRWRRSEQEQRGAVGPAGRLMELTPEQEELLQPVLAKGNEDRLRQAFFEENLRRRLEALGVDDPTIEKILSLPPRQRQGRIMRTLRSLSADATELSPEARTILENLLKRRSLPRRQRHRNGSTKPPNRQ